MDDSIDLDSKLRFYWGFCKFLINFVEIEKAGGDTSCQFLLKSNN